MSHPHIFAPNEEKLVTEQQSDTRNQRRQQTHRDDNGQQMKVITLAATMKMNFAFAIVVTVVCHLCLHFGFTVANCPGFLFLEGTVTTNAIFFNTGRFLGSNCIDKEKKTTCVNLSMSRHGQSSIKSMMSSNPEKDELFLNVHFKLLVSERSKKQSSSYK